LISLPASVRVLLWREPVDGRRGFDGLSMLVRAAGEDPFSGHLFVFVSRRRLQARVLTWQSGGLALLTKRLDRGVFRLPPASAGERVALDGVGLAMLLDGIDVSAVRRPRSWAPPAGRPAA
jgi:transposase